MNCPELYLVALDGNGNPVPGALLTTTVAGSSSLPKAIYSDAACSITHPNPLPAGGDGVFPQFYLEDGGYRFALAYPDGAQLRPPRDYVNGSGAGGGDVVLDHKVNPATANGTPGYLADGLLTDGTLEIAVQNSGTASEKVLLRLSNDAVAEMGKVSADGIGEPGYLGDVLRPGDGIQIVTVVGTDRTIEVQSLGVVASQEGAAPGYLEQVLVNGPGIELTPVGNQLRVEADLAGLVDHKVLVSATDEIAGFLISKIRAGAGITITAIDDEANGEQLWIDSKANFWTPVRLVGLTGVDQHYTVTDADATIAISTSGTGFVDLPAPTYLYNGRRYIIQGRSAATGLTIQAGGTPIAGVSTVAGYGRVEAICIAKNDGTYQWIGA